MKCSAIFFFSKKYGKGFGQDFGKDFVEDFGKYFRKDFGEDPHITHKSNYKIGKLYTKHRL